LALAAAGETGAIVCSTIPAQSTLGREFSAEGKRRSGMLDKAAQPDPVQRNLSKITHPQRLTKVVTLNIEDTARRRWRRRNRPLCGPNRTNPNRYTREM
jgi:hypothetical protein